jgi:hypothetical protein
MSEAGHLHLLSVASLPARRQSSNAGPSHGRTFSNQAARYLLDDSGKAFPQRIVHPPIPFVNSLSDLLALTLAAPSTAAHATARKAFATLSDYHDSYYHTPQKAPQQPKQARHE